MRFPIGTMGRCFFVCALPFWLRFSARAFECHWSRLRSVDTSCAASGRAQVATLMRRKRSRRPRALRPARRDDRLLRCPGAEAVDPVLVGILARRGETVGIGEEGGDVCEARPQRPDARARLAGDQVIGDRVGDQVAGAGAQRLPAGSAHRGTALPLQVEGV
jgi:hypothetical protein